MMLDDFPTQLESIGDPNATVPTQIFEHQNNRMFVVHTVKGCASYFPDPTAPIMYMC